MEAEEPASIFLAPVGGIGAAGSEEVQLGAHSKSWMIAPLLRPIGHTFKVDARRHAVSPRSATGGRDPEPPRENLPNQTAFLHHAARTMISSDPRLSVPFHRCC